MSTVGTATAYSNQKKINRTSNGVAWVASQVSSDETHLSYSTDNGVTWTTYGGILGAAQGITQASVYIDVDDYMHVAWRANGTGGARTSGYMYYVRGTPNASRTAWTWSSVVTVHGGIQCSYPDLVAHKEGTGWVVHIVSSYFDSGGTNLYATYNDITISSAGAFTLGTGGLATLAGGAGTLSANYGINSVAWASVDFNHTGDGKTVAGGTPHIYITWGAGTAANGVRFRRRAYSGGAWSWGTESTLFTGRWPHQDGTNSFNGFFDGTRFIVAGMLYNGTNFDFMVYQRDAADTATSGWLLTVGNDDNAALYGSSTYDTEGNVYIFGRGNGIAKPLQYRKWLRETAAFESAVVVDNIGVGATPYVSPKIAGASSVEWVYTSGNNAPFQVKFDRLGAQPVGLLIRGLKSTAYLWREKMRLRGYEVY